MIPRKLYALLFILALAFETRAQFSLKVSTDKTNYNYGEPIVVRLTVENLSDTTKSILSYGYDSAQAEFFFNEYSSLKNSITFPSSQELIFLPHSKRVYKWTINPWQLGIPDKSGEQTIIGYHLNFPGLWDTIKITAPKYFGGQLYVGIADTLYAQLRPLMDSLRIKVLTSSHYDFLHSIDELWQIEGYSIDSLKTIFSHDKRFKWIEYNRRIHYDKVIVVSVKEKYFLPTDYSMNIYPNPFNPETKIRYQIPIGGKVRITIYNMLGQIVKVLLDEEQPPGIYEILLNCTDLGSGVYFSTMTTDNFVMTKKLLLLK